MKLIIVAITLIAAVSCQNIVGGWTKGPDGYKYFSPEEKMELPSEEKLLEYLPPSEGVNEISDEPIGVNEFAPYIGKSLDEIEATTFKFEIV